MSYRNLVSIRDCLRQTDRTCRCNGGCIKHIKNHKLQLIKVLIDRKHVQNKPRNPGATTESNEFRNNN